MTKRRLRPNRNMIPMQDDLERYVDAGYFVHFSNINKLGINPQSSFKTPLGIYGYPLTREIYEQLYEQQLPFAQDRRYLLLFAMTDPTRVEDLGSIEAREVEWYVSQIEKKYPSAFVGGIPFTNGKIWARRPKSGQSLWRLTKDLSDTPLQWNKLFRSLGIDGVVDFGDGTIHPDEPIQAVFFSKAAVSLVASYDNVYTNSASLLKEYVVRADRTKSPEELAQLATVLDLNLLYHVLLNPYINFQVIDVVLGTLAKYENQFAADSLREMIAGHSRTSPKTLRELSLRNSSVSVDVLRKVAINPNTPKDVLKEMATNRQRYNWEIRHEVAWNLSTPMTTLQVLMTDPNPHVRESAIERSQGKMKFSDI